MKHILVVDDDLELAEMLQVALRNAGYSVETASNGEQAIKRHRSKQADLVLLDLIMPDKDGLETLRELRQDFPGTKVIAMSAGGRLDPNGYLSMAVRLGAIRSLTKPFELDVLLQSIEEILDEGDVR